MPTRTTTTTTDPLVFPHYLLPPLSFLLSAPKLYSTSKKSAASATSAAAADSTPPQHLPGTTQFLKCRGCLSDLCTTNAIISKGFTGRHGRAYLLSHLSSPSVTFTAPTSRALMTGLHIVADMACGVCGEDLGWRYDGAEEVEQRYKVGKYILEREKVVKGSAWEVVEVGAAGAEGEEEKGGKKEGEGEEVRVDVSDEVEMGWLVRGMWTAEKALERRRRRKDGGGK